MPFKKNCILILFRKDVIERTVTNGKIILVVLQSDFFRIIKNGSKNTALFRFHLFVIDYQSGKNKWRNVRVLLQFIGSKGNKTIISAKTNISVGKHGTTVRSKLLYGNSIEDIIVGALFRLDIIT